MAIAAIKVRLVGLDFIELHTRRFRADVGCLYLRL
jgi:hypothetical protein